MCPIPGAKNLKQENSYICTKGVMRQGRSQDLTGGGGQQIFLSDLEICLSLHFAMEVRGMRHEKIFKE